MGCTPLANVHSSCGNGGCPVTRSTVLVETFDHHVRQPELAQSLKYDQLQGLPRLGKARTGMSSTPTHKQGTLSS